MSIEGAFCEAMHNARIKRGLSQQALADLLGHPFHGTTIWRMEGGRRRVCLDEAVAIAAVLDIELPALVSGIESDLCGRCFGSPPVGFTCNECGVTR